MKHVPSKKFIVHDHSNTFSTSKILYGVIPEGVYPFNTQL